MKTRTNQTKTPPTAAPRGNREAHPSKRPEWTLLTVTLNTEASAAVRRFAEEFGENVRDVASGCILDSLPQALEEWEDTKRARKNGKSALLDYWLGTLEKVREARLRRLGKRCGALLEGEAMPERAKG